MLSDSNFQWTNPYRQNDKISNNSINRIEKQEIQRTLLWLIILKKGVSKIAYFP